MDYADALTNALNRCDFSVPLTTSVISTSYAVFGCRFYSGLETARSHLVIKYDALDEIAIVCIGQIYSGKAHIAFYGSEDSPTVNEPLAPYLLRRYEAHGDYFLNGIEGQYAVAVWDSRTNELLLVRDPIGMKSLFIYRDGHVLCFSSDLRVLQFLANCLKPSLPAIIDYLVFNYPLADRTFYRDVYRIMPGELYHETLDGLCKGTPVLKLFTPTADRDAYLAACKYAVAQQITQQGVGVGFHLSGGIDTSLICHIAAEQLEDPITAFSAYYDIDQADVIYSRIVAEEINADLQWIPINIIDYVTSLKPLIRFISSPIMAIGVPTFWFLAQAAKLRECTIILSGVGADQPLIGWKRLTDVTIEEDPSTQDIYRACVNIDPDTLRKFVINKRFGDLIDQLSLDFEQQLDRNLAPARSIERFYSNNFMQEHLRMADITHAYHGVTICHPFLQSLVYALGLALSVEKKNAQSKSFLREILKGYRSEAARRMKKEQMAPLLDSFRNITREAFLAEFEDYDRRIPGLDYDHLIHFVVSSHPQPKEVTRLLWALFNIHSWLRVIDQPFPNY